MDVILPSSGGDATTAAEPTRNLLIIHTPARQGLDDWLAIQELINRRAPDIDVRIAVNGRPSSTTRRWQGRRPSLVFSAVAIDTYRPAGGRIYAGMPFNRTDKLQELTRLADAGLPVPRTIPFAPDARLDENEWGPFVVAKPVIGAEGRGIRLVRTADAARRHDELTRRFGPMLIQQFVEHIDSSGRRGGYRILTIFGTELYAIYRARGPTRAGPGRDR